MSKSQAGWIIVLLSCIVLITSLIYFHSLSSQTKWEYKLESPDDYSFEREMNEFGADGWELVFARRATNSYSGASYEMIFKRRLVSKKNK